MVAGDVAADGVAAVDSVDSMIHRAVADPVPPKPPQHGTVHPAVLTATKIGAREFGACDWTPSQKHPQDEVPANSLNHSLFSHKMSGELQ